MVLLTDLALQLGRQRNRLLERDASAAEEPIIEREKDATS
jgi:hypothetical protein